MQVTYISVFAFAFLKFWCGYDFFGVSFLFSGSHTHKPDNSHPESSCV